MKLTDALFLQKAGFTDYFQLGCLFPKRPCLLPISHEPCISNLCHGIRTLIYQSSASVRSFRC